MPPKIARKRAVKASVSTPLVPPDSTITLGEEETPIALNTSSSIKSTIKSIYPLEILLDTKQVDLTTDKQSTI